MLRLRRIEPLEHRPMPRPCVRAASVASASSVTSAHPGLSSRSSSSLSSASPLSRAPEARAEHMQRREVLLEAQVPKLGHPSLLSTMSPVRAR